MRKFETLKNSMGKVIVVERTVTIVEQDRVDAWLEDLKDSATSFFPMENTKPRYISLQKEMSY